MTKYIAKKIVGGMAYHLDCIINDVQHDYMSPDGINVGMNFEDELL